MNPLQGLLHLLSDPNIAFILFTVGFYGLHLRAPEPQLRRPASWAASSIVLAFIGFGSLPLNLAGLLLIAIGLILFILDLHVTNHGLPTIAGSGLLRPRRRRAVHGAGLADRSRVRSRCRCSSR